MITRLAATNRTTPIGSRPPENQRHLRIVNYLGNYIEPEMPFTVEVPSNRGLKWPSRCACCGDAAEAVVRAESVKENYERKIKATHEVPACRICFEHYWLTRPGPFSAFLALSALGIMISIIASSFGFGLVCFALWETALVLFLKVSVKKRRSRGYALLKSNCASARFVAFYRHRTPSPSGDFLTFDSESYAQDFCKFNEGTISKR